MNHKFTLQGIRNPSYYPAVINPLNFTKIFQSKFYFISLDLKGFQFKENDDLINILINRPYLKFLIYLIAILFIIILIMI